MRSATNAVRLLIVPGLHDSGPAHWQTDLQHRHRRARRVQQHDWQTPDLDRWAERIGKTLAQEPAGAWLAVAHGFGCLALARWLQRSGKNDRGVRAAVLVAPADPLKFGVAEALPRTPLAIESVLVASRTDPWMAFDAAAHWAQVWGCRLVDLGDAAHINAESGHGPWPLGRLLVERQLQRLERQRRVERAHPMEFAFSV